MSQFVVGLGEVLWDMFPKGKRLGGAPANFAYHAAQFGHESLVVSAIGLDKLGSAIISELDKHALAVQLSAYVCTQKGAMPVIPNELVHVSRIRTIETQRNPPGGGAGNPCI